MVTAAGTLDSALNMLVLAYWTILLARKKGGQSNLYPPERPQSEAVAVTVDDGLALFVQEHLSP